MKEHGMIRKGIRLFLAAVLMVAAVLGTAAPVMAAEGDGVYTVNVNRYFLDPQTGLSGWGTSENEAIGQGMVESAVSSTGLLEIVDGRYYLTIRIILAGSVSNVSFGVRNNGASDYAGLAAYCTQDNTASNNTIDYCMEIPDTSCTVAGFMYVEKMGTDVVFFATLSGSAQPGSADFAVTNYSEAAAAVPQTGSTNTGVSVPTATAGESSVAIQTEAASQAESSSEETSAEETSEAETTTEAETETEAESTKAAETETQSKGSSVNTVLIVVIVVLAAVIIAGAAVILAKRKKDTK